MTPVGCAVGPPITGQLTLKGIPVLGLVDTGASVTCMGFLFVVAIPRPMGSLEAFRGSRARRSRETSANRGENAAFRHAMGQSTRARMLYCDYWAGINALPDWDGHHVAAPRTHRCNQWHRDARSTGFSNDPPKCRPAAGCYSPRR